VITEVVVVVYGGAGSWKLLDGWEML
jgi:2-phospho-L-lactate transferase/gluconeogenesis factor (CofD/UPF0052 family)